MIVLLLLLLFDIVWVLFPESELEVLNFLRFSLPMPGMPAAAVLILSMILLFIEPAEATPLPNLDFFSLEE